MKRLTSRWQSGIANYSAGKLPDVIERLAKIEDILGDDYDLDRLRELVEAERDGRCVVLPCKENDTVFYLTGKPTLKAGQSFDRVEEGKVDGFYWDRRGVQIRIRNPKGNHGTYGFFGETVYTDKRAAEAALKGGSDGI